MRLESLKNLEDAISNDSNPENDDFNFLNNMNEALANLRSEQAFSQLNSGRQNSHSYKPHKNSQNGGESEISKLFHNNKSIYNSSKIFPETRLDLPDRNEVASFWDLTEDGGESRGKGEVGVVFDAEGELAQMGGREEVSSAQDPGENRKSGFREVKDEKMCASLVGVPFREKSSAGKRSTIKQKSRLQVEIRRFIDFNA